MNPVTLGLLTVIGEGAVGVPQTTRLHPHLGDYAAWSMSHLHTIEGPRLILGNPPYTRLQLIPRNQRSTLQQAAGGLCGSRASLSALMLGTALHRLASGDGLCLLLPAQWLESNYADRLRQWLWDASSRRVELHSFHRPFDKPFTLRSDQERRVRSHRSSSLSSQAMMNSVGATPKRQARCHNGCTRLVISTSIRSAASAVADSRTHIHLFWAESCRAKLRGC